MRSAISFITSIWRKASSKTLTAKPSRRTCGLFYAVTRCLEIISEASRRLPNELKARHPTISWKQMADAGNVYRHDYEDVAAQLVWDTVQRSLPPLKLVIETEIRGSST